MARTDSPRWHVASHHRTCADNRTFTNGDTGMNERLGAYPCIGTDCNWPGYEWECGIGVVVGPRTKVCALGYHGAMTYRDDSHAVNDGLVGYPDPIAAHQHPRGPDLSPRVDMAAASKLGAETAKHENSPSMQRTRGPGDQQAVGGFPQQPAQPITEREAGFIIKCGVDRHGAKTEG